ncbi:aldose 1-epimerase family protein [uncultured Pseudokineococcus sp.]|uniref:aldose 1-epimerase family protein n=1 Tax=uncultured Pseudokineococcus sp. TaxID=1642928 RepID=UPI002616FD24|nr:aldose 1-epimerase family protein [uncultured Pseudokineococcus sp.]
MDEVRIASDRLSVVVARHGAELQSLRFAPPAGDGGPGGDDPLELLWQAGPEWRRHAPVLFPVVGRVADDEVVVDGRRYPMGQHGFARDSDFELLEASPSRAVLRLVDDGSTREHYPFPFSLVVAYDVAGDALSVRWTVSTHGDEPLPYSLGWHPAFRWPLVDGVAKTDHVVRFAEPEPDDVRGVRGGLLTEPVPTPVQGDVLPLQEGLFADDAVVMDPVRSRTVRYGAPGTPTVRLDVEGFPQLGVWSKPSGADFVCLEPWAGLASPEGWQGELRDKPYGQHVAPGGVREAACTVTVEPPA